MATLSELAVEAAGCTKCPLAATRTNVVFGVGDPHAPLMIVGEAPGKDEDEQGEPFVGPSGKLLDQVMQEELGVTRARVFIANTLQCRPPGNRDPLPEEIATCRPWLEAKHHEAAGQVLSLAQRRDSRPDVSSLRGAPQRRRATAGADARRLHPRQARIGRRRSVVVITTTITHSVEETDALAAKVAGMA